MSIPPYPEANSFGNVDGQPTGTRVPIKYIWPKRIAVILAGLAVVGGIGFGAKTLLQSDDAASTSRETVQSPSQAPAPTQAPQSPAPGASPAPQSPTGSTAPMALSAISWGITMLQPAPRKNTPRTTTR